MKTLKVLIIDGNAQYTRMFKDAGWDTTYNIEEADLLQFTGGADVSPFLYGEVPHVSTYSDARRDLVEAGYYAWACRTNKPMAGVCRGGQFLNVMNGGSMFQDVDGHAIGGTHACYDRFSGETIQVTSTHHQMMIPAVHGELIAVADEATRLTYMCNDKEWTIESTGDEAEVIYYDRTKSLCFQPHPEFHGADSTRNYYFQLLERYLGL